MRAALDEASLQLLSGAASNGALVVEAPLGRTPMLFLNETDNDHTVFGSGVSGTGNWSQTGLGMELYMDPATERLVIGDVSRRLNISLTPNLIMRLVVSPISCLT